MAEFLRLVGAAVVFACFIGAVWLFQDWRDRRLRRAAVNASKSDRIRIPIFASRFGTFLIWCITAVSGLALIVAFFAIFFGLFSGYAGLADLSYLVAAFVIAGLIYLWADRILGERMH